MTLRPPAIIYAFWDEVIVIEEHAARLPPVIVQAEENNLTGLNKSFRIPHMKVPVIKNETPIFPAATLAFTGTCCPGILL
jgi:hypothetical protein